MFVEWFSERNYRLFAECYQVLSYAVLAAVRQISDT